MRSYLSAQVQIRRRWLLATAIVPALLIADASQLTASANPMMRGGPMHHHRGGGGFGTGVGVGIGVGIGAMMINQIQRQQAQNAQQAPANQKAQKPAAKKDGGKAATAKNKKKDAPGLANKKDDPNASGKNQDNPALTTKKDEPGTAGKPASATPALTSHQVVTPVPAPPPANCNDCLPLWEAIVRHHKAIVADIEKLRRARLELEDNKANRAKLVVQLRTAAPADKQSFQTLIDYTDQTIAHRTMFNDELERIIEEEKARLAELIAEYQRCVDKLCAKKVAEPAVAPPPRVVETPVAPPPAAPPAAPPAPPPEQPPLAPPTKVSTTPLQPAPASTPTNANRAICGPDVTDLVVNALRRLKKQFDGANDDVRKAACETITSVNTGPKSWDIAALSPNTAPLPNTQYSPAVDGWTDNSGKVRKQPWFTGVSKACAIPRPTCGATVEFMGTCQHAQVVNYTQWGMMTELCGGHYKAIGGALHAAWNLVAYWGGAPGVAQDNMVAVGKELKEELDKDPTNGTAPDVSGITSRLQERVQAMGDYEFKQCELACKLTPKELKDLQNRGFHADWVGLNSFQRF